MSDRLSGIAAFIEAVEAGSFAGAARRLNLSRSAIGKSIARLEERLDVRLFNRTTRQQSLTDEGEAYFERCQRALAELIEAETALDARRAEPTGTLRVSAPVQLGRHCVAPILVGLATRHPKLQLDLSLADRFVDLTEERIDLAIRITPLPESIGLTARKIGSFGMVFCAAPNYLARHGEPKVPSDLRDHHCLAYGRGGRAKAWTFFGEGGREELIDTTGRIRIEDIESLADAAVAGAGIASMPCWLVRDRVASGALVPVLGSYRTLDYDVYACWPQTRHMPSKVRAAVDALVAGMQEQLRGRAKG
ncbi:LysR substrate-binding domain-containing protein [Lacibacterium aquatile]|uniref:LysR substrate-binding domain-containing protein n=1 Tax=Lacibacterium aquatile TaxID=1168082 RepID=A0ABW5DWD5_9PROT